MFRIFEAGTNILLEEFPKLDKAKRYAELYKINFGKDCSIMECKTIWATSTLEELLNESN